jgi:hypothetical protein
MASPIDDKSKSPAQKAADARPVSDGPHRPVKKKKSEQVAKSDNPAYVVAVSKKEKSDDDKIETTSMKYDPKELRVKARSLLKNPNISSEHKKVLAEILGPEDEPT